MDKPTIKISVFNRIEDDEEPYIVSDDGGDFDDSEEYESEADAVGDAEERKWHYENAGFAVVIEFC